MNQQFVLFEVPVGRFYNLWTEPGKLCPCFQSLCKAKWSSCWLSLHMEDIFIFIISKKTFSEVLTEKKQSRGMKFFICFRLSEQHWLLPAFVCKVRKAVHERGEKVKGAAEVTRNEKEQRQRSGKRQRKKKVKRRQQHVKRWREDKIKRGRQEEIIKQRKDTYGGVAGEREGKMTELGYTACPRNTPPNTHSSLPVR